MTDDYHTDNPLTKQPTSRLYNPPPRVMLNLFQHLISEVKGLLVIPRHSDTLKFSKTPIYQHTTAY